VAQTPPLPASSLTQPSEQADGRLVDRPLCPQCMPPRPMMFEEWLDWAAGQNPEPEAARITLTCEACDTIIETSDDFEWWLVSVVAVNATTDARAAWPARWSTP
jgi:hypothetical protein